MAIIDKIQLSGTVYTIGQETTTAVTSASTDNEIPTAKAVYDAIPTGGTGGGKAISAGTNISVTTGETADTVSCTLPITANTGSITIGGYSSNPSTNSGRDCFVTGCKNTIGTPQSQFNLIAGYNNTIGGGIMGSDAAAVIGWNSSANSDFAIAMGDNSNANKESSFALGKYVNANNVAEHSVGKYNVSNSGSTTSAQTLFSVGNGTSSARHNAFEIRQNGDIYITLDGQDVKLQDNLGGGGASYSAGTGIDITNDVISVSGVSHNSLADGTKMLLKGDVTSVGQNYSSIEFQYYYGTSSNKNNITIKPLTINGNSALRTQPLSISVVETSSITTSVTSSSTDAQVPSAKAVYDQMGGMKIVKLTQSAYDALTTKDASTIYFIVN